MAIPEIGNQPVKNPVRSQPATPKQTGPNAPSHPGESSATAAVPVETLRGRAPQVATSAPQEALSRQSRAAGEARGVLTDPKAILEHELKTRNLQEAYGKLDPRQRQQFDALARGLVPPGTRVDAGAKEPGPFPHGSGDKQSMERLQAFGDRTNLYNLLQAGQLGNKDSQGRTLLSNLQDIQQSHYPEAKATLSAALGAPQPPMMGIQTLSSKFTGAQPSEYARVANGLMRDGQVKLANGETLHRPPSDAPQPGSQMGTGMMSTPYSKVERALTVYADEKLSKPEIASRVQRSTANQFSNDPNFNRLSAQQKEQFLDLAAPKDSRRAAALSVATGIGEPVAPVDNRVSALLANGRLTSVDSRGDTLLTNLHRLRGQQSGKGFEGSQVYGEVLNTLSPPPGWPARREWSAALEQDARSGQPAEYVRVVAGLTGSQGKVSLPGGRELRTPPDQRPDPQPGFPPFPRSTEGLVREAVLAEGIRSGQPMKLVNSDGVRQDVQITMLGCGPNSDNYRVRVGQDEFSVSAPPGFRQTESLARLADYHSMTPPHLRGELKHVAINEGHFPGDAEAGKRYGIKDFQSAATAGGHRIDFWSGTRNVNEGTFNHETGHLIGERASREGQRNSASSTIATLALLPLSPFIKSPEPGPDPNHWNVPAGWDAQSKKDGNAIDGPLTGENRAYSTRHEGEDFAESWMAYMRARSQGKVADFAREHPNRAPGVDRIYHNQGWQ